MARISETELERLKADVPVGRLAETSGVVLSRRGGDLVGLCPFHEDREPSLVITPAKNLFHCFGCGAAGGPVDWVMRRQGVSFRHAVELLRDDVGLRSEPGESAVSSGFSRLAPPVSVDEDDQAVLDRVVGYYHDCLKRSPEALAYLETRGLNDPLLIETFRLGFANRTLGLRLPDKRRREGMAIRTRLERLGLYRASGHEHFNGSLVVPILDAAGHAAELYGRKITSNLRAGTPLHLYLPGPHRGVWNGAGLTAGGGEVILCEALIDAMSFWVAGYRHVTAAYGVEGLTSDHLAAFQAHGVRRVLIAFDRDEAGDRGAAKVAERLASIGIESGRVLFPKGLDANAYALKVTPAHQSFGVLLRQAGGTVGSSPTGVPSLAAPSLAAKEGSGLIEGSPAAQEEPNLPVRDEIEAAISDTEITLRFGPRRYRVRGFERNQSVEVMRINLLAGTETAFHVDTLDLYSARQRAGFVQQAATELGVAADTIRGDLGRVLLKLETLQDSRLRESLAPVATPVLSADERDAALSLLRSPDLLDRIVADFAACGLVGETTNKLVGYLAAVSRKLPGPLAVLVQSSSAAGKSSLMDAVLAFVPEEERVRYSAMTGQSLFYMGETNLKHRILAICEEEGASRAAYALKLLQSDGELTIASTGKDPATGSMVTQEYRVEGPVMIFLTTTAIDIDEELLNRCLVLSVDEGRAQTEAIHRLQRQRRTLAGLIARDAKADLLALHRNAQSLLQPLAVVNPYADRLSFLSDRTRSRRDHEKYLTLIDAIALLHQHQRPIRQVERAGRTIDYVEVLPSDIGWANRLAHEILGRSLDDLPPQTRRLLILLAAMVAERMQTLCVPRSEIRFTRREVRERTGWGDTQLKLHLSRLAELEHVLVHRAARGQGFVYELLYDGDGSAAPHLSGLLDAGSLTDGGYDAQRSGQDGNRSESGRVAVGVKSGGRRIASGAVSASLAAIGDDEAPESEESRPNGTAHPVASYAPFPVAAH